MEMKQNLDHVEIQSTARKDLILIIGLSGVVFVLSVIFDVFDHCVDWYLEFGRSIGGSIDEVVIVLIILAFRIIRLKQMKFKTFSDETRREAVAQPSMEP